jgi:hypothetical protein
MLIPSPILPGRVVHSGPWRLMPLPCTGQRVSVVCGIIQSSRPFFVAESRVKATIQFFDDKLSSEEIIKMLQDPVFKRQPEMIRALVPACVSLQIPVKMGMKLVAQTAALFWSVEHVFCNFEVGNDRKQNIVFSGGLMVALFLTQWLYSVERDGISELTNEEGRVLSLLGDLLHEADPDAESQHPMSARLLIVWADQFDGVNVWGSTSPRLILLTGSYAESGQDLSVCGGDDSRGEGVQHG